MKTSKLIPRPAPCCWVLTSALLLLAFAPLLSAQSTYVYPAKGQTTEQTEKDKAECYTWAKQQSGFDPAQPTPTVAQPSGQVGKTAARGAAVGAVGGAIGGDAGKGAAAGAATGALVGGMRKRDDAQAAAQQQAAIDQQRDSYNRAYKACLEGKGYTVK